MTGLSIIFDVVKKRLAQENENDQMETSLRVSIELTIQLNLLEKWLVFHWNCYQISNIFSILLQIRKNMAVNATIQSL